MFSAQICAVSRNCLPLAALPPVSGQLNPILIGSAAIAATDRAASTSAGANAFLIISRPPPARGAPKLPHSRRKPGSTDQMLQRRNSGSRLSPGMRNFCLLFLLAARCRLFSNINPLHSPSRIAGAGGGADRHGFGDLRNLILAQLDIERRQVLLKPLDAF